MLLCKSSNSSHKAIIPNPIAVTGSGRAILRRMTSKWAGGGKRAFDHRRMILLEMLLSSSSSSSFSFFSYLGCVSAIGYLAHR